jgi:hypothetical protein
MTIHCFNSEIHIILKTVLFMLHVIYFDVCITGPQDAAGGLLKRQADLAVLRGQANIQNGRDLYEFAVANLTRTKSVCRRRIFRFADSITRDLNLQFKPVCNIRSVHQVLADHSSSKITMRELSCFCENCVSQNFDKCRNVSKAGEFRSVEMVNETGIIDVELENNCNEESLSDLVSKGHVIAVYTDDQDYDYFLLKVQEPVHVLESEKTDSWGSTLPAGTEVITGLYYDNNKKKPLSYKLIPKLKAVVPATSVIYICSELDAITNITLEEDVHLTILNAINEILMS